MCSGFLEHPPQLREFFDDDQSLMQESTIRSLMLSKGNFGLSCMDFYDKIKSKKDLHKWCSVIMVEVVLDVGAYVLE